MAALPTVRSRCRTPAARLRRLTETEQTLEFPCPSRSRFLPADSRWRCGHCGNLTRFDVLRSRRAQEYWHFTMSGEPEVEETEVRADIVEQVTCRWCGASDRIEIVPRPAGDGGGAGAGAGWADAGGPDAGATGPGGTP